MHSARIVPQTAAHEVQSVKHIAAIVLAAGSSSRFGRPKQLLNWGSKPLVVHVASVALAASLDPVVIVLGPEAQAAEAVLEQAFPEDLRRGRLRISVNWRPEHGLSGSVRAGLAALPPSCDGAFLMQGDAPLVTPDLLRELVTRLEASGGVIAHPTVKGDLRPPVLFARTLFAELGALEGDLGGRVVADLHKHEAATLELDRPQLIADIDTPADYEALRVHSPSAQGIREETADHTRLAAICSLIIDMDGVLWHGNTPLPGLPEFFGFLRENDISFMLATNNSSLMPRQYSAKLARFGVQVPPEQVLTSSQATAAYVASICKPASHVYVIGGDGIRHALEAEGLVLTEHGAECVVVGWDRDLTWQKLKSASLLIHHGAHFVGTNPDNSYPTEHGPAPGNGAQLAAIRATTGVEPIVVGKPEPWLYQEAVRRMGAAPDATAAVGDRIETDIAGGKRAGLTTILLLSGIARLADVSQSPTKPDLILRDIRELVSIWREVRAAAGQAGHQRL